MVMKKISLIAVLMFALVAFVGCVDHQDRDDKPLLDDIAPEQLYASFESVVSRTAVQDDKYVLWSENDRIAYFPRMNSNVQYVLQSTSATDEGYCIFQRISDNVRQGDTLQYNYAVYPYAENISIPSDGDISISLPDVQHYAEASFGVGAAPMVAVANDEEDILHFKNVAGFLKLQLYGEGVVVKRIEICGNNNEKLAGAATIVVESGSSPKVIVQDEARDRVVLECGEGVCLSDKESEATPFWFALPEVEFSKGFYVAIYDADNTVYVKKTTNSYTIERNTIQLMKAFDVKNDTTLDIVDDGGNVLFYLSERNGGVRKTICAAEHNWAECAVQVNGKAYEIEFDNLNRPYIRVERNENNTYNAVLLVPNSEKWYTSSPYEGVVLPCSQFDSTAAATIRTMPMYAVYTKSNGRNLVFDYGFALLNLRVRGEGDLISARVEAANRYDVTGAVAHINGDGYRIDKGMNFAALNCTNGSAFVSLNANNYRDLYLMVAPGDYGDGLRLSLCDTDRKAAFYDLSDVVVEAGDVYRYETEYKPNEKQIFYEGFDNCVWGGDVMRGSEGVGFSPDDSVVKYNTNLDRDGYAEALAMVAYSTPGTGFIQSNVWDEVSPYDVLTSHQTTDSYIVSRNFTDVKYLFRVQEHPGYIAAGTATTVRGIYRTPMIRNMEGVGSFKFTMKFALQAGFNGALQMQVVNGGRIVSAVLDGKELTVDSSNCVYKNVTSTLTVALSHLNVPSSVKETKEWQTLEIEVADAMNGSRVDIRDVRSDTGVHGIYIDSVEAVQVSEWKRKSSTLRVLLWNIQNGMWADQHNNYDNFVEWVKKWNPDVCIWCESETNYKDKTNTSTSTKYLPDGWAQLCKRYGHSYAAVGGNRDNFPQTVTSKYPITTLQKITDTNVSGKPVSHGAGHFTITVNGKKVNIVSLHMWPQAYGYGVATADRETSKANNEGDKYRAFEMQYIVDCTVKNSKYANEEYWIFGGDTNSRSRLDEWYYNYESAAVKLLTHDVVLNQTNLKDVIGHRYPGMFMASTYGGVRIDILYASPAMYDMIDNSAVIIDEWIVDSKKSEYTSSFYDRSDHRPILVNFDLSK